MNVSTEDLGICVNAHCEYVLVVERSRVMGNQDGKAEQEGQMLSRDDRLCNHEWLEHCHRDKTSDQDVVV